MDTPTYDYWEKALADPKALHRREFYITTDPQLGFYRTRKGEPIAIFLDEDSGQVIMYRGAPYRDVRSDDYEDLWLDAAKHPVPEAWYRLVADDGGTWPDLDTTVAAIGDNRRGADIEGLINDLASQADTYKEISDDDTAARAISLRAAILEQHKRADKEREEQKAPYLKEARQVDELWMPMVKKAKKAADTLRALAEAWETRKRRLAREEDDRRRAAEILQIPVTPVEVPEPTDQIRTGYGRAVSVRTRMVVTGIRDWGEVLRWYTGDERLLNALVVIAQKDTDDGRQPAGFAIEERAVVR